MSRDNWLAKKEASPVRIQWDPERDVLLQPLQQRAIQIGLGQEAVRPYVNEWIQCVTDVTPLAHAVHELVENQQFAAAQALLPKELPYPVGAHLAATIDLSA